MAQPTPVDLSDVKESILKYAQAYGYAYRTFKQGKEKLVHIITGASTFISIDLAQDWFYGSLADDTTNNVNGDLSRPEDVAHLMLKLARHAGEGF